MRKLTSLFLALTILMSTSFIAPKSHAAIGLIVKSRVTTTIGGIGMGTGLVAGGTIVAIGFAEGSLSGALITIAGVYLGAITLGIGLVILDDKSIADAEFAPVSKELTPEFSSEAIAIYNSELEELNAVRKTIQVEMEGNESLSTSNALWNAYNGILSQETVAIAEAQAQKFMNNLKSI